MSVDIRELIRERIATAESVHVRDLSEGTAHINQRTIAA